MVLSRRLKLIGQSIFIHHRNSMGSTESTQEYQACSTISIPRLDLKTASNAELAAWLKRNFILDDRGQILLRCLQDPLIVAKHKSYLVRSGALYIRIFFFDRRTRKGYHRSCHLKEVPRK